MINTKPKPKQTAITVRIDDDLLQSFKNVCDGKGYQQSFVIRELIKRYVKDNKQQDLFQ